MMFFIIAAGILPVFAAATLGVVGFAVFGMAEVIASGEDTAESSRDDDNDLAVRVGAALESIAEMPYSCIPWLSSMSIREHLGKCLYKVLPRIEKWQKLRSGRKLHLSVAYH